MDEWTTQQQTQLQVALDKRYKDLLAMVREELTNTEQPEWLALAERITDVGIESVADVLTDARAVSVDHHVAELRAIEAARLRIRQGRYGACVDCASDIGFDRLHALPTAERCITCQQERDATYGGAPRPTL